MSWKITTGVKVRVLTKSRFLYSKHIDGIPEIFPWSKNIKEKLKTIFNIDKFRSQQLETINVTMSKIDVILVAPTGGGKSLCFQLPAVSDTGLTLVVSPLISLMGEFKGFL